MKVLIIEDEMVAANQLKIMIREYQRDIEILDILDNNLDSINYLTTHKPDLIFMDIHLADGLCFEIFEQIAVDTPVIFTTAYDQYTLKAFKINSVDYLLKPIHPKDLKDSIDKFKRYQPPQAMLAKMIQDLAGTRAAYKCRFLVRSGHGYISIKTDDVAYVISKNKLNYLVSTDDKKYVVDHTMDQLQNLLDPREFQRINRNFIVSNQSIKRMDSYFNNRMLLQLHPACSQEVLVSRSYLKEFKEWVDL